MRKIHFTLITLVMFACFVYLAPYGGSEPARVEPPAGNKPEKHRKNGDEYFNGPILSLEIEFAPEEYEKLKRDQRSYAEGTIKEGGETYKHVAIKLKGAAGSFQGIDGKPGMTVSFDKFKGSERFHGLKKLHLNNCAQDGTYLNELIGGAMARKAGVPASRCTHAFVKLNGRDLGLYVVKEAFTKDFLAYFYKDQDGDLWDGGFCKEVEENMEKDQGDPKDKAAIKELIGACQEGDNAKRWERLGKILDVDRFISYCAMEAILCHWDGYNFNRNNYRVYRDPQTGKLSFFLHGMDQLFADANQPLMRDFGAMVGNALMRCPEAQRLYRLRLDSIYANVLAAVDWGARVTEEGTQVKDAIAAKNPQWAKEYQGRIAETRSRVEQRIVAIGKQLDALPRPLEFDKDGVAKIGGAWLPQQSGGGVIDQPKLEGKVCLHIVAQGPTMSSWRKTMRLDPGTYRLEALAKSAGVVASDDAKGKGAGLRISGVTQKRANSLEGNSDWKRLSEEFNTPGGDVALVAELRATGGEVWFQNDSMQIVRVK